MTDFAVTGKKRTGKGLFSAAMIQEKLLKGCRVATNMDIFLEHMFGPTNKCTLIRLPDCPTVADLEAIGRGYEGEYDDEKNGIIILDEASKYFNSRQFGDKERQPMLDWLIHSGKLGWDVYYQMQGLVQVDKQIRDTQIEYHVSVKNTNRWPIPFLTPLLGLVGINLRFPKMHLGIIRHGCERDSMIVGRKWYKSADLYKAYDTRQVFLDRDHPKACAIHTVLSAWHIRGRYLKYTPIYPLRFVYGVLGIDWTSDEYQNKGKAKPAYKPKLKLVHALSKLPPDQAVKHWHRLDRLGAFECAA